MREIHAATSSSLSAFSARETALLASNWTDTFFLPACRGSASEAVSDDDDDDVAWLRLLLILIAWLRLSSSQPSASAAADSVDDDACDDDEDEDEEDDDDDEEDDDGVDRGRPAPRSQPFSCLGS